MYSPAPRTASAERFRERRLSIKTSEDVVGEHDEKREKLSQSLRQSWDKEVVRFYQETGHHLGSYRQGQVTKDGVLGTLKQQYGSDSKEAKKRDEFYGTVEKILNGVELVAAVAADAASVVFGPAQMCFGALEILFSIPKAFKSFAEELSALFREVSSALGLFNIYDRIDQRGMLDPALVTSNNELLITLVDICMLAWKAIKHPTRTVLGNVFLKNDAISGALGNFRDLIKKQNDLTSTMTLEAVLQNGDLSRRILSKSTRIEQSTKRIEETTHEISVVGKETNAVSKDTNVYVRGLAADSLENKNLKVDRDRIAQIDKALELTDSTVSALLDELRQPRIRNLEDIISVLESNDDYKLWDDFLASEMTARRMLYIGGDTKSGKTKLLSAVVQQIDIRRKKLHSEQKEALKDKQQKDDRSIYITYYSFEATAKGKDRGKFNTAPHAAFKAIAAQIARQSTRYSSTLMESLGDLQKGEKTLQELWNSLELNNFDAPVGSILYMFFDGLDHLKSADLKAFGTVIRTKSSTKKSKDDATQDDAPQYDVPKLKLRVIFTGKADNHNDLDITGLTYLDVERINGPLIKKYVESHLLENDIFQDNDEDSRSTKARVVDIIQEKSNGSFDIAIQKLDMLMRAIDEDEDAESLMEKLQSDTFNTSVDDGFKILDPVTSSISEQHREQLKELLMWIHWGKQISYDFKLLEAALFLQRDKKSLEPLKKKMQGRFTNVFEISDTSVYVQYAIAEAIRYSTNTATSTDVSEKKSEISINISVKNADDASVKQFFWDLSKSVTEGTFDFSNKVQTTNEANRLSFDKAQMEFTILLRLLRALNDDRVRRQASPLIEYAASSLPTHLKDFEADLEARPMAEVSVIGKGIVNFLSDEETIGAAWDHCAFSEDPWLDEDNLRAVKKLLVYSKDHLDPIERRWADKHTMKGSRKASFLSTMVKVVARKWLADPSRKVNARRCYDFLDSYLRMLEEPDFDESEDTENETAEPSRASSPVDPAPAANGDDTAERTVAEVEQQHAEKEAEEAHRGEELQEKESAEKEALNAVVADTHTEPPTTSLTNGVSTPSPETEGQTVLDSSPTLTSSATIEQASQSEVAVSPNTSQLNGGGETNSVGALDLPATSDISEAKPVDEVSRTETSIVDPKSTTTPEAVPHHTSGVIQPLLGNFSASSSEIELVKNSILLATCTDVDGYSRQAAINLNDCLGFRRGKLRWEKNGQALVYAQDVRLVKNNTVLEARLEDDDYHWGWRRIILDERISNQNGRLEFLDPALEDTAAHENDDNVDEIDTQLVQTQKLKKVEDWAVALLELELDWLAFERLGYTMIGYNSDAAIEYFNKSEPGTDARAKYIGLASAYEDKSEYQLAMDSIQVALDIFRADESQQDVETVSKEDRENYDLYGEIKDLFRCLHRASSFQENLGNKTAAMDLMEEALKIRPWECWIRWNLLTDLCKDSQHERAQALYDDWQKNARPMDFDTPIQYMLKAGDLQPIIYASKGMPLQATVEEALKEAVKEAHDHSHEEDELSLLCDLGFLYGSRGDPASKESAKRYWMDAIRIARDVALESTSLDSSCKRLCGLFFDATMAEFNSQQQIPRILSTRLKEDITLWTVSTLSSQNVVEQPMLYTVAFALLNDQLDTAKAMLKQDMTDALSILCDDDVWNDDAGIKLLCKVLFHIGDTSGAIAAFSLLSRLENRPMLEERLKKEAEQQKGENSTDSDKPAEEDKKEENENNNSESKDSEAKPEAEENEQKSEKPESGEADQEDEEAEEEEEAEHEVDKYMYLYCDGCNSSFPSWTEDVEIWWCRYCPSTGFCAECRDKLRENKLEKYVCNPTHELVLIRHIEYEKGDLDGETVRVGGTLRYEPVEKKQEDETMKKLTKLTREGGERMSLQAWIEILKKEWDITETTKLEGTLQQ